MVYLLAFVCRIYRVRYEIWKKHDEFDLPEAIEQFCRDHLGLMGSCFARVRARRREQQIMLFADEVRRQQVLGHGAAELEADKEELRRREVARAQLDRQLLDGEAHEDGVKNAIARRRSSALSGLVTNNAKPHAKTTNENKKKAATGNANADWDQWDIACRPETTLNPQLHEEPELPSPSHYVPLEETHRELEYVSSRFIEHVIHACNERAYERASRRNASFDAQKN